jgi:hypothetical protein
MDIIEMNAHFESSFNNIMGFFLYSNLK